MPFKSKAQRRKFAELLVKGEISPETYEEWNRETGGRDLPERVSRKRPGTRKRTRTRTRTRTRKSTRKSTRKTARRPGTKARRSRR